MRCCWIKKLEAKVRLVFVVEDVEIFHVSVRPGIDLSFHRPLHTRRVVRTGSVSEPAWGSGDKALRLPVINLIGPSQRTRWFYNERKIRREILASRRERMPF
jgi:hypothetical protein